MKLHFFKSRYQWYFPVFIGLILVVGVVASVYVYMKVNESGRASLLYRAETIARSIDPEEITVLQGGPSDVYLSEYLKLKKKLQAMRVANPDSRFVYIMGKKSAGLFFYADSENPDSEDYSAPGDIYQDESPAFETALTEGEAGTEGPIKDSFGNWVTGVAPIFGNEGEIVGAVGIDVSASSYTARAITYAVVPILLSILLSVFAYAGLRINRAEKKWIELRTQFVTMASHELRSPLTGLLWANQALSKNESLPREQRKTVNEMKSVTGHLLEAVNDILDAAQFESEAKLVVDDCDLRSIVRGVVKDQEFAAESRDVQVIVDLPQEAMIMKGSETKLVRVFNNLISNAIKYSKRGGEVRVSGSIDAEKKNYILKIKDNGIGIPENELGKIFDGFYRGSNVDSLKIKGTGLGVYVVKQIVEAHLGSLSLKSNEGQGTEVEVTLPCVL